MAYSKEELLQIIDIEKDPTWNLSRSIFAVTPSKAYLQRIDGKAPEVLTKDNLDQVLALMYQGGSLNEVCSVLGITRQTLQRWCAKEGLIFDHLRDTIATGLIHSVAWWERIGRQALMGETKYFKDHLYALHMMNKFGWLSGKSASERAVKQEVTHQHRVEVPDLREIKKVAFKQEDNIIDITPKVVSEAKSYNEVGGRDKGPLTGEES